MIEFSKKRFFPATPLALAAFSIPCQGDVGLGECVSGIYNWSLAIVGIVAFVQIIYAGWLYLSAAGNTANTSAAMSKISNAVLGIILLFSSYLILNTINPDLVGGGLGLPDLMGNKIERVNYGNGGAIADALNPLTVPEGGILTLSGLNFNANSEVFIDGKKYNNFQVLDSLRIEVLLDSSFKEGEEHSVFAENGEESTTPQIFTVVGKDKIVLTALNPSSGLAGSNVSAIGYNFTSEIGVLWDMKKVASSFVDESAISFKVPTDTSIGSHEVILKFGDEEIGPVNFTVIKVGGDNFSGGNGEGNSLDSSGGMLFICRDGIGFPYGHACDPAWCFEPDWGLGCRYWESDISEDYVGNSGCEGDEVRIGGGSCTCPIPGGCDINGICNKKSECDELPSRNTTVPTTNPNCHDEPYLYESPCFDCGPDGGPSWRLITGTRRVCD